jgi:hypothetical protein
MAKAHTQPPTDVRRARANEKPRWGRTLQLNDFLVLSFWLYPATAEKSRVRQIIMESRCHNH